MKNHKQKTIRTGLLVTMLVFPLVSIGGVYTCLRDGVITYSDQRCPAGSTVPDAVVQPAALSHKAPSEQKSAMSERKLLEQRIGEMDERLLWLYRERRAAFETFAARQSEQAAQAGDDPDHEDRMVQQRQAFEEQYDNTIKDLRRELVAMQDELAALRSGLHKTAYASR